MSKSLETGIEALLFLSTRKSVGVTELADALDINKSTAFRILNTFLKANMVKRTVKHLNISLAPPYCSYPNSIIRTSASLPSPSR